jgi:hypothetical protein
MKTAFVTGTKVRAKSSNPDTAEVAEIVRYDCEGFYIVKRNRGIRGFVNYVVHEDDIEVAS